ncbi:MAG TPA: histidine kinase [Chitinophagaceae bacterium]|nr:histidine kinase [Chitinophagaceae bacterium]
MKYTFLILLWFIVIRVSVQGNCDCSLADGKAGWSLLLQSPDKNCQALGYEVYAEELVKGKKLDSAMYCLENALNYYLYSNCPPFRQAAVYKQMASIAENKADFSSALSFNLKALELTEKENNGLEQASVLLNIAQVFNRLKQSDKGIEYTRQSLPLVEKLNASVTKAELLNKITARYFYYFQDIQQPVFADTAEYYVRQALSVARDVQNIKEQIIALTRLNAIYESRGEYKKALDFIDQALVMCVQGVHGRQLTTLYGDKGNLLRQMGDFKEARRFADSCLFYCEAEKYPPLISNAWSLIYDIEHEAGNFKEALFARNKEKHINDSLSSADRARAVNELEKKYNQAKNERTIKELAQQKQIWILIGLAALLVALVIAFFLRQQSLKHKQRILETEQRLNRARMNPHFFFNALASLQSFAIRENDGQAIAVNLSKFSHIMRETLESTYKEYVTVEQEIDFLREYLDVQKIRFPQKFSFTIEADPDLETDEVQIPAMIIQPFVENSVEHGFSGIDYTGNIRVYFSKEGKELRILIEDNGKGLIAGNQEKEGHVSRASQIIRDRIYLLNLKLRTKASFSIDSGNGQQGVQVKIHLPLLYKEDI